MRPLPLLRFPQLCVLQALRFELSASRSFLQPRLLENSVQQMSPRPTGTSELPVRIAVIGSGYVPRPVAPLLWTRASLLTSASSTVSLVLQPLTCFRRSSLSARMERFVTFRSNCLRRWAYYRIRRSDVETQLTSFDSPFPACRCTPDIPQGNALGMDAASITVNPEGLEATSFRIDTPMRSVNGGEPDRPAHGQCPSASLTCQTRSRRLT